MFIRRPVSTGQIRLALSIAAGVLPFGGLSLLTGCGSGAGPLPSATTEAITTPEAIASLIERAASDSTPIARTTPGSAIPGLTATELARFTTGKTQFLTAEDPDEGLGPVFNGRSCGECHSQGAVGGAAFDTTVSVVTRFGGLSNGKYTDLTEIGGPVLQRRSIQEIDPTIAVKPESVPPEAMFVSRRTTTPLFGAGLIEVIPEATITRLADPKDRDHDGISGRVNSVYNPETHRTEIGRFGWKAQVSSLTVFAADAYLNEMGVTTPLFPIDLKPQGLTVPGIDTVADPEDEGEDTQKFADFMRFLAPPTVARTAQSDRGRAVFERVGCVSCHVSELTTGDNAVAAFSHKRVPLFSDLLLHDMGSGLADGIQQGSATGNEFRTAPLWGARLRKFYLHDGRATSIQSAVEWHGGEATRVMERYGRLPERDKNDLIRFVGSL